MPSSDFEEKGIKPAVFDGDFSEEPELPPNLQAVAHRGFLGTLRHYENLLDKKIGVEAHGPARILPDNRDPAYGNWSNQIVMCVKSQTCLCSFFYAEIAEGVLCEKEKND